MPEPAYDWMSHWRNILQDRRFQQDIQYRPEETEFKRRFFQQYVEPEFDSYDPEQQGKIREYFEAIPQSFGEYAQRFGASVAGQVAQAAVGLPTLLGKGVAAFPGTEAIRSGVERLSQFQKGIPGRVERAIGRPELGPPSTAESVSAGLTSAVAELAIPGGIIGKVLPKVARAGKLIEKVPDLGRRISIPAVKQLGKQVARTATEGAALGTVYESLHKPGDVKAAATAAGQWAALSAPLPLLGNLIGRAYTRLRGKEAIEQGIKEGAYKPPPQRPIPRPEGYVPVQEQYPGAAQTPGLPQGIFPLERPQTAIVPARNGLRGIGQPITTKVVDDSGNPKVLTHYGFKDQRDKWLLPTEQREPRKVFEYGLVGHWFSDHPSGTGQYGPNRVNAVLEIKNPLYAGERSDSLTLEAFTRVVNEFDGQLPLNLRHRTMNVLPGIIDSNGKIALDKATIEKVYRTVIPENPSKRDMQYEINWARLIDDYTSSDNRSKGGFPKDKWDSLSPTGSNLGIREKLTKVVQSLGYDGYLARDGSWVAFKSTQIKPLTPGLPPGIFPLERPQTGIVAAGNGLRGRGQPLPPGIFPLSAKSEEVVRALALGKPIGPNAMRQVMPEIVAEGPELARGILAEQAMARKTGQAVVDIAGREPTKSFDLPVAKLYEEVVAGSIQDLGGGTRQSALNEMIATVTDFDPIKRTVKEIPDSDAIALMRAAGFRADINDPNHVRKAKSIIRKAFGEGYKNSPYATSEKTILENAVEFSGKRASSALAQEPTITKAQQVGSKNISEPMDFGQATQKANQLRTRTPGEYGQTAIVSPIFDLGGAKTGKYRVIWGDLDPDATAALTKDIDRLARNLPIYPSTVATGHTGFLKPVMMSVEKLRSLPLAEPLEKIETGAKAESMSRARISIEKGKPFPVEITLTENGPIISDGRHTLKAAQEVGLKEIPVRIIQAGKGYLTPDSARIAIDNLKRVIPDADKMIAEGALHEAELTAKATEKGIRIERQSLRRYVAALPDGTKKTLTTKKAVAEFTALWEGQGYNVDILSALERGSISPDALGVSALGKGAELISKGVTDFAAWSKQMAKEMGPQVQEMLKGIWEEVSPAGKFAKAETEATAAIRRNMEYMFSKGKRTKPVVIPPDATDIGGGEPILGKLLELEGKGQFIKSGIFRGLTRQDRHFARLETQFGVPLWSEVYQPLRHIDDVVAHANLESRYHEKVWKIMRGFTAEKHKLIPNYIDGMDLGEVQLPRMIANAVKASDEMAVRELYIQQEAIRAATADIERLFTPKDKMLLGQLDEFFKEFMAKNLAPAGIKPKKYYFPHIMRRDYSTLPFNEWLQMKSFPTSGDPEFWHKLKRFYIADDLETNAPKAVHKYIDRFYFNKYKKPVFDEVLPKVEAWKKNMDEATFTFVRNFLESARGYPGRDRAALETTMRNLFDALPEKVNVKYGPGWDRAVDNMVALMYSSGLGFSPGFMLRNLTQPLINTYPIVSTVAFAKGLVDTFANPRMWQRAKSVPGLLDRDMMSAPIDLYGDTWFQGLLSGVVQKTMTGNRMTEMINRVASFSMGVHEVAPMIEKRLPWEQMIKRSRALRTLEKPEKEYLSGLYNAGKRTEFENQFGLMVARKGNFDYSKLNRPQALQTIPGKIAGMYGTYPMNMLAGISQVMRNGTTADKIVIGTKWAAVNAALFGTFASMGIDATRWLFLSPVAYTGGQAVDILQNVGTAIAGGPMLLANEYERIMKSKGEPYPGYLRDFRASNSQAIQAAANLRKQLPYLLTPAGGQIRRTIRAFEEPTLERGVQRVLGFAPKAKSKTEPKWRRLKRRRPAGSTR